MMRLLVIGFDRTVADKESAAAKRHLDYFAGWQVTFLEIGAGAPVTVELRDGMRVVCPGGRNVTDVLWKGMRALLSIIFSRGSFDVVTAQDPYVAGVFGYAAALKMRSPLLIQDHSAALARWPRGAKEWLMRPFALFVLRRATRVRTVSQRGASALRSHGILSERIDVVPVASDQARFVAAERKPEPFHLVTIGRLSPEKGIDVLLRAMRRLKGRFPVLCLTVVGDGPLRGELEALRDELGVAVTFAGHTDPLPFLQRATLYVQPSHYEGWGIAVTEAAAARVPVVMTDVGLAGEVIKDRESGRIVAPADDEALAQAIGDMLDSPDTATGYARAAIDALDVLPSREAAVRAIRTGYLRTQDGQDAPRDPELRLFLSALAIRLAVLAVIVTFAGVEGLFLPDTKAYLGLAHALLEGRGFVHEGVAFSYRTIGYPLFLAALLPWMKSLVLIAIVQVCVASALPQLVQAVGRKLGLSTRVRRTAAWMTVFEPHTVYYSALIMTEWIFPVLTLLALLTALRAVKTRRLRHAAIAGVWFGIGLLVKPLWMAVPVLVFLGAAMGRVFNVWRPSWRACAVWVAVVGVIVSPWLVRNYLTFGTWNLSSQGPSAAVFYLGSSIVSVAERVSYQEAEERLRRMFEEQTGLSRYEDGHDRSLVYTAFAKELIQTYPGAFARVIVGSTISFWTSHNYAYIPHYYHLTPPIDKSVLPPTHYLVQGRYGDFVSGFVKIFGQPFYFLGAVGRGIWLVIGLFMLYGLFATLKRSPKEPGHWIVLALFLALTATVWVNGLGVEGRLRLPVMPLQWLYAAAGIAALVRARRRREPGQLPSLLIMTQRVDEDDRNLAVHLRWIRMFVSMGVRVTVIAQSVGPYALPEQVTVFSLGKEAGASKGSQLLRFVRLAWPALKNADRALVLMSPVYVLLLAPLAVLRDCPLYLWYTHKHVSRTLRAAVWCVRLVFSASPESFRLETPKVRFLGHAIDTDFFVPADLPRDPLDLVTVGRLSRAKRIEHMIEAVKLLRRDGRDYHLTVIGEPIMEEDHAYIANLKHRVAQEGLDGWVLFLGGRSPEDVRTVYQRAGACLNASQTGSLDKVLLEAMACGCPVVTTNEAFRMIVPEGFVEVDSPEALARVLARVLAHPLDAATLRERVTVGHDMRKTLRKMLELMQRHL